MGFFEKLRGGISKAASAAAETASRVIDKTADAVETAAETVWTVIDKTTEMVQAATEKFMDAAISATEWAVNKLGEAIYDGSSIESRKGVEQALADFRFGIREQAREAEEASIASAMGSFDEFADILKDSFQELVELVRIRQEETEKLLTDTIMNYVQEHISENDLAFQVVLNLDPGDEKRETLEKHMQSMIDDAQDFFGKRLKEQIELLNEELNVRLDQAIKAQEQHLQGVKNTYEALAQQQAGETMDIQKLEEKCLPVVEAACCIEKITDSCISKCL